MGAFPIQFTAIWLWQCLRLPTTPRILSEGNLLGRGHSFLQRGRCHPLPLPLFLFWFHPRFPGSSTTCRIMDRTTGSPQIPPRRGGFDLKRICTPVRMSWVVGSHFHQQSSSAASKALYHRFSLTSNCAK